MEERYTSGKFNGGDRGMPAKALKASIVRHIGLDGEI